MRWFSRGCRTPVGEIISSRKPLDEYLWHFTIPQEVGANLWQRNGYFKFDNHDHAGLMRGSCQNRPMLCQSPCRRSSISKLKAILVPSQRNTVPISLWYLTLGDH